MALRIGINAILMMMAGISALSWLWKSAKLLCMLRRVRRNWRRNFVGFHKIHAGVITMKN
jgi:hypothetical protein